MKVTLAKTQVRSSDDIGKRCDECVGQAIVTDGAESALVAEISEAIGTRTNTQTYNIFIPGVGTHQFQLHPHCAEGLRA